MMASVSDVPPEQWPISEQYRVAAEVWGDAEAAADILEQLKSVVLEQKKCVLIASNPGMSDAAAERLVKASQEWELHVREICDARSTANKLRQELEVIRMRHREWIAGNADARQEQRLLGMHP